MTNNKWKTQLDNAKASAKKHWKVLTVAGAAVLVIGGGAAYFGGEKLRHEFEDHMDERHGYDGEHHSNQLSASDLDLTYTQWQQTINQSSLSATDKGTLLSLIQKNKSTITDIETTQKKIEEAYTKNLGTIESDYKKLLSSHSDLWKKISDDAGLPDDLGEVTSEELSEIKSDITASSLSDADKKTLTDDVNQASTLQEKWAKAYDTYTQSVIDLEKSLEKSEKTLKKALNAEKKLVSQVIDWNDEEDDSFDGDHDVDYDYDDEDEATTSNQDTNSNQNNA